MAKSNELPSKEQVDLVKAKINLMKEASKELGVNTVQGKKILSEARKAEKLVKTFENLVK